MTTFPSRINQRTCRGLSLAVATLLFIGACSTHDVGPARVVTTQSQNADESKTPECCSVKKPAASTDATPHNASGIAIPDLSPKTEPPAVVTNLTIADAELIDQDKRRIHFYSDLVQGKTVAIINFFTSCTTVCPTLTATMARVQRHLLEQGRDDIQLISISVDPVTDTPARLKAWSKTFGAKPGWSFLTGTKRTVDQLLKSLRSFTPAPEDHSPMVLIGNEPKGIWKQMYGLSGAADIARAIVEMAGPKKVTDAGHKPADGAHAGPASPPANDAAVQAGAEENEGARKYFSDVELVDQNGERLRLYSDLMKGRVILVNSFFASCTGVCPVMNKKLSEIRDHFSDHMGADLFFLSISVDPLVDTPARLQEYATGLRAGPGWYFLTGTKENVATALHKFGMAVESRENHSNLFMIGNVPTGLWKKAFGLAPASSLTKIVEDVLNDRDSS